MKSKYTCQQCRLEYLGRCFCPNNHGNDVSMKNEICPYFVNGLEPHSVTFETVMQLENYLKEFFYTMDFCSEFTRKQLKQILDLLFPHMMKENGADKSFSNMCKKRMVHHIEFYIKLHHLKCKRKQ